MRKLAKLDPIKWHCDAMLHYPTDTKVWPHVRILHFIFTAAFVIIMNIIHFSISTSDGFSSNFCLLYSCCIRALHFLGENCACLKTTWTNREKLLPFILEHALFLCVLVHFSTWHISRRAVTSTPHTGILHNGSTRRKLWKLIYQNNVCNAISKYYFYWISSARWVLARNKFNGT